MHLYVYGLMCGPSPIVDINQDIEKLQKFDYFPALPTEFRIVSMMKGSLEKTPLSKSYI